MYGWEVGELTAIERAEPYTVNVVLMKGHGKIFFANPTYRVVLEPGGNASMFIILYPWAEEDDFEYGGNIPRGRVPSHVKCKA